MFGGVVVGAAVRTWPFRVYSFPTEISVPAFSLEKLQYLTTIYYSKEAIQLLQQGSNPATRKELAF